MNGLYQLNPDVEADVAIEGDIVTITCVLVFEQWDHAATLPRDTYTFRYADDCKFEGFCPDERVSISRSDFERVLKQKNRTCLAFVVEHGEIVKGLIIP